MNAVFGRTDKGLIDRRGKWLGLLFLGLVALAYSLSCLLPAISAIPLGAGLGWKRQWPVAVAPALLTPLILWKAPTDFLPILLGDYLAMHFALYGMLTGAGLWLSKRPLAGRPFAVSLRACALPAFLVATTIVFGLGAPIDLFVTSFAPTSLRWILIPIMFCCTSIYFLTDEWLTRGDGAARGGPLFTRFCFLVSLGIAVALNPQKLFFLIIIIPVIFIFFCIFGLFSRWTYARTRDPRVAAFGNAAGLAWAICVTFPIVGA
jgi:hypothetical protein